MSKAMTDRAITPGEWCAEKPDQRTSFPIITGEEAEEIKARMRLDDASIYAR